MYKRMEQSIIEEMYRLIPHIGGVTVTEEEKNLQEIHENAQIIGGPGRRDVCDAKERSSCVWKTRNQVALAESRVSDSEPFNGVSTAANPDRADRQTCCLGCQ